MAKGVNRKRGKKKTNTDRSLWGSLFRGQEDKDNDLRRSFFSHGEEPGGDDEEDAPSRNLLSVLWHSFNFWSVLAVGIFLTFTLVLFIFLLRMWMPQDLSDIAGYQDNGRARDLETLITGAQGAPVTISEAELNRYLRDTCRMRQTGIFSIIASGQGVAVRIHDGYAELVLDRMLGANIHQTTSINLTFRQENKLGRPELAVDFKGGKAIAGALPRGGTIGSVPVPQRHIRMLRPALETLLSCYPRIAEAVEHYHYCPLFTQGKNGQESCIHLVPYTPS